MNPKLAFTLGAAAAVSVVVAFNAHDAGAQSRSVTYDEFGDERACIDLRDADEDGFCELDYVESWRSTGDPEAPAVAGHVRARVSCARALAELHSLAQHVDTCTKTDGRRWRGRQAPAACQEEGPQ